ncbi:hypothetical protein Scep_029986 [Stephania cephalantha]|uniref:Uncharacterized protein n=1 Tax=Stephania cephalantha TaxID=152367 RepID=A0AAP0DYP6_9MAGN
MLLRFAYCFRFSPVLLCFHAIAFALPSRLSPLSLRSSPVALPFSLGPVFRPFAQRFRSPQWSRTHGPHAQSAAAYCFRSHGHGLTAHAPRLANAFFLLTRPVGRRATTAEVQPAAGGRRAATGGRRASHYQEAFMRRSRCNDVPATDDGGGRRSLVASDEEADPAVKTSPVRFVKEME